ncbi:hypothetical protein ACOME3_000899 [Neoechinorhynchus agilis]
MLAGQYDIPEVTIYFDNKLLKGNRSTKVDSQGLHAFETPNYPPLASVDYKINVRYDLIRPTSTKPLKVFTGVHSNIGIFRIFPSVNGDMLRRFCSGNISAIVLQTYGMGNIPINNADFIDAIDDVTSSGTMIINCTQCQKGYVDAIYEAGAILGEKGVVSGNDMTIECALAKLAYVFGHHEWSMEQKKKVMLTSIRGELTESTSSDANSKVVCKTCMQRIRTISQTQNSRSNSHSELFLDPLFESILEKDEASIDALRESGLKLKLPEAFVGMFLCHAASTNDVQSLICWQKAGAVMSYKDYKDNDPLEIAKSKGSKDAEKYLMNALSTHETNMQCLQVLGCKIRFSEINHY